MGFVVALLILSLMIIFHEMGHFLAARYFGVTVERFSVGFGPVIAKKWCCGTEWAISALPLGGYVKMKGQDDTDPTKRSGEPDSYDAKKPWQRIIILLAGPFANFLLAFLFYLIIALAGYDTLSSKVGKVMPGSAAEAAGIKPGDVIVAIDREPVRTWEDLSDIIAKADHPLAITIRRDHHTLTLTITPKITRTKNIFGETVERPMIGISPAREYVKVRVGSIEAIGLAWKKTIESTKFILVGIEKIVEGVVSPKEIGGVISIMDLTAKASQIGMVALLSLSALISVNLGILNLLPIPALDGGHIVINLYEWITHRPPSQEVLYRLTVAGWVFLMGLMGLGLYNDINRLMGVGHG